MRDTPSIVGRSREIARLNAAVARISEGAVFVELVGEAGIGKTTMLASLTEAAARDDLVVFASRASEFERDLPFGLFVHALDEHLATLDARWSRSLGAEELAELGAIFPALGATDAMAHRQRLPVERFQAHRAVRALLERLAATRPIVLTFDDVHWADSSSIELVGALLRRPPAARVLVALTYRAHQAPERLASELAVAVDAGLLERIELGPLSEADAGLLLDEGAARRRDRQQLYDASGGNPFYLLQLLRIAGRTPATKDLDGAVPQPVAAALATELRGVSQLARLLAQAAAVAGEPFDLDLAAQIAELERHDALCGLDELLAAGIVRSDDKPLRFVFRHPLVRRAVYVSARPGWRVAAHGRAARALHRRRVPVGTRAHHVELSAAVGDEKAIALLIAAASAEIVPASAAHWLKAALRLVPRHDDQRLALLCELGAALSAAGLLEESRTALVEALGLWPTDEAPDARSALIVSCAIVERLLGRHDQARARLSAAARALPDPDSPAGVAFAIELTSAHIFRGEFDAVREPAVAAVRRAAALGDPVLLGVALALAAVADYCMRDRARAAARIVDASQMICGLDDAALAAHPAALYALAWAELFLDRFDVAAGHFEHGVRVARASGHSQLYVELRVGRAFALCATGRLAEALAAADEAVEAARLSDYPQHLAFALGISCAAKTDTGQLASAILDGREAVALGLEAAGARVAPTTTAMTVSPPIAATSGVSLAFALAELGEWAEAVELILTWAGGPTLAQVYPGARAEVYEVLTRAELGLGHLDRAAQWARLAAAAVDGEDCWLPLAHADRAIAAVLLANGDCAGAAGRALTSARNADAVNARVEAARSRMLAGRALGAAGEREQAGVQLRCAETQLALCGARRLRQECIRELRRIGLRVARAGVRGDATGQGLASLSGREREVADLVRARHTNREIAGMLFVSEKTVESHLRSVFVKLGVQSRADVARSIDAA